MFWIERQAGNILIQMYYYIGQCNYLNSYFSAVTLFTPETINCFKGVVKEADQGNCFTKITAWNIYCLLQQQYGTRTLDLRKHSAVSLTISWVRNTLYTLYICPQPLRLESLKFKICFTKKQKIMKLRPLCYCCFTWLLLPRCLPVPGATMANRAPRPPPSLLLVAGQ